MILGIVIVLLIVLGLTVVYYRGALYEFQILQKDYSPSMKWADFLSEQLPLVIRNIPKKWAGNWSEEVAMKPWMVTVGKGNGKGKDAKKSKTISWREWLAYPSSPILNAKELGLKTKLDITIQHWEPLRRWYWIPVGSPTPYVLSSNPHNLCIGLQKTTADATAIVSTSGSPLEVWVSHEGGIPSSLTDTLTGKNPWIQSTNEIPGVENVKFIEILLRPGNVIVLPAHWWFAIRCHTHTKRSWFWTHEFHSPVSWIATAIKNKN